jgi:hypothetical protein
MAKEYKILGSVAGSGNLSTYNTLYSVPENKSAVVSTITLCNETNSSITYRLGVSNSANTPTSGNFLSYGATIAANDTVALTLGLTLESGKFLRVSSSSASASMFAFGSEIS